MNPNLSIADQNAEIQLRNQQASSYDEHAQRTRTNFGLFGLRHTIFSLLKLRKDDRILEVGCGTGLYTLPIAQRVKSIYAFDFSVKSVEVLQDKARRMGINNINAVVADALKITLPSVAFDKAVILDVLQHIPGFEARVDILCRVRDSLQAGGRIVLMAYRYGGWIKPPAPQEEFNHSGIGLYRFAFTPDDVRDHFSQAGFQIEHIGGALNVPKKIRKRLPVWMSPIDAWISQLPASRYFGDYIIASAIKQ